MHTVTKAAEEAAAEPFVVSMASETAGQRTCSAERSEMVTAVAFTATPAATVSVKLRRARYVTPAT